MNYTVYWDLETSSAKTTGFTQVISCSALLTDENFNEIDRLDEVCRLNKFVTAEPMALLVNGFNPYDLKQNQSSYEMAQSIAEKFTKWIDKYKDITFIAYNNSFDVTLFRYMMYTNLLIDKLYIMNTLPSSEIDGLKLSWALGTFSDNFLLLESGSVKNFQTEATCRALFSARSGDQTREKRRALTLRFEFQQQRLQGV